MDAVKQAVVLVGGRGTRLGEATKLTPKPLLPIQGEKVFLDYLLAAIAEAGMREIVLLAGHLGEQVEARYQGKTVGSSSIVVAREAAPMGTGGAVRLIRNRLDSIFMLSNGDSFFDIDMSCVGQNLQTEDLGEIALRQVPDGRRFGVVEYRDGRIVTFHEKDPARKGACWISSGVYVLRREIFDRVAEGPASIESDIFPVVAAAGRLAGSQLDGYFIDIGLPDTLEQARQELPALPRFK